VAVWVFVRHRRHFARLRNVMLLTNLLALAGYELYPMSPPRLTTGLIYNGHRFVFQDTMRHILGTGKLNGTPIGYNPLSAMPSLHVAWAIIMGVTLILLARNPLLRAFGAVYPVLMVFTVVVTANHYVMDAIGAALAVTVATAIALGWEILKARRDRSSGGSAGDPVVVVMESRPRALAIEPEYGYSPDMHPDTVSL
jgi:PAP2 superfamily